MKPPLLLNGQPWLHDEPTPAPIAQPSPRPTTPTAPCGCCRLDRPSYECCPTALIRAYELAEMRNPPSVRVFDHLESAPLSMLPGDEEERLMNAARWTRASTHWHLVTPYAAPEAVSGEVES